MKEVSKPFGLLLIAVILITSVLASCGTRTIQEKTATRSTSSAIDTGTEAAEPTIDISREVEIAWYLIGGPPKDYDMVLSEFNKKAKAELNATLKVNWIGWGDFQTKYPLILASGEPIDMVYTATWLNYYQQAVKGAFMPLEEIGPEYAPRSFADEPVDAIKQATINGHLYALPPNYTAYATYGPIVRGDLMKKYGLGEIKTIDDFGAYLDAVAKNDKNLDPAGMYSTQHPIDSLYYMSQNLYPLAGDISANCPFWIDFTDKSGKVVNVVEKADLPEFLRKMKGWYEKGYWPKSVMSNKDQSMLRNGKAASLIQNQDHWVSNYLVHPEWDLQYTNFIMPSYTLPYMQDGMAIPITAMNPERALMLLEKLRNDQSYYNLLTYGIEGKHNEITANDKIKALHPKGFSSGAWGFRENKFYKDLAGLPAKFKDMRELDKSKSRPNIYTNFSINTDPIRSEYTSILNVMEQYYTPLILGYVDVDEGLATLKAQLKAAGAEKVQAEFQRQVDEFRASSN